MTTFDQAHMGDKIRIESLDDGWLSPIRLVTEPCSCHRDCLSCRGVAEDGKVIPVHAGAARRIQVLQPGPMSASELTTRSGDVLAEHADRPLWTPWSAADDPEGRAAQGDYDLDTPHDEGDDN